MKLKKSLVKPVMRQNISSCLLLPPEIGMHYAIMLFSERLPSHSCMTISGGRTEQHVVIGLESWLQSVRIRRHSFCILTK